jgi:hypothetical protein
MRKPEHMPERQVRRHVGAKTLAKWAKDWGCPATAVEEAGLQLAKRARAQQTEMATHHSAAPVLLAVSLL